MLVGLRRSFARGLRAKNASDRDYLARTGKISATLARPQVSTLYENLLLPNPTGQINYALQRTFYAASGKAAELRAAIVEGDKTPSPGAVGKGVSVQVLGPDAPHYVLTTLFTSLDGYEQYLKAQPSDPNVQKFASQIPTLTSGSHQELSRILCRFTDK